MATILIVDDLRANRAYLVTLLRFHGHRLLEASNGEEGLTLVRAERPDLVITDVLMPVMDGYELVRQLRLDPATRGVPVVFYTAQYGEREARTLALANGVAYVLIKPADSSEVLAVVGRALSGASDTFTPPDPPRRVEAFDREHLRLVTNKLSETVDDLRGTNARLRALVNIGLELGSERDADKLLHSVCAAARDLFGATYVTLGIVDLNDRTVRRFATCGTEPGEWVKAGDSVSGILGTVVSERKTLRGQYSAGESAVVQFHASHPPVQAYLAAPVASPSHVYGWVCLVGNEGREFTEDDEALVIALSGQVGRVYENNHLHGIAAKHAEELEREIVERKEVESALRVERDRSQRYLDTAEVILLALDVEGRITLINRKGGDLLGWDKADLLGLDWVETCIPTRLRKTLRETLRGVRRGELSASENLVLTRAGAEKMILWRNTVLRDETGNVVGTFSSGTDTTEQNQAVEALRSADERTRFALEAAGVGIWDMDAVTGAVRWSETLEAQYGLAPGTFGGTIEAFTERVHPADRESVIETIGKAMRTGTDYSVLHRSTRSDSGVRWLSGAGRFQLDEKGRPLRGVGISLDVTERHTLEEQYQQAQKMEAIGRLAGGVAHDFNNLLTAILGYCELILSDLDGGDPLHADVSEIQKAGERAASLTRQLLAFSRKQIIEPTLLDLNLIVADMKVMLERLIGDQVKIIHKTLPEPALVNADRGQMEQIVLNLSVNARDAMPDGGTLTIEISNVDLDETYSRSHVLAKAGEYVMLTVSDTGTGMTPEVQDRLFEPFFTTKTPGKGTGLGLATVHGIVLRSGGSVQVYSEVGWGSSFKLYFPRADPLEQVVGAAADPAPRPRSEPHTVLLVDDAEIVRDLARRLLLRQGYTVLAAASAEEALEVFSQNSSIDLVLTDVVMPGGSGADLARKLLEKRPDLKVIYMSGYTDEAIVQHGVLNPGIAFIPKPFSSESLERKIREVLDR